jgi:molybdenum transport protein
MHFSLPHFSPLSDTALDQLIHEDAPYFDLTTHALGIGDQIGRLYFVSRNEAVVCGTEEATRVLERCGAQVTFSIVSGRMVVPQQVFLEAEGSVAALHMGWKVAVTLVEYLSGIATTTFEMVRTARLVNSSVQIATTRKMFPGTRSLAIKGVLAGGGMPHRLGLSETVLIFPHHYGFLGGLEGCLAKLDEVRLRCPEKHIAVEVSSPAEAQMAAQAGVDIVQTDKMSLEALQETVALVRAVDDRICIAAAGGINAQNVEPFAATGVDVIVTSSLYAAKPADIRVDMER